MVNYKEFYINNKPKPGKTRCCEEELNNSIDCNGILPQQLGEYLKIKNHLSEYNTKADRELVLANLGIDSSIKEYLKNKIGCIYEDIEHGRFLAFENEDTRNQYLETGDESLILTQWHNELENGLPIYTKDIADRLIDIDPERYIVIPDETDITNAPLIENNVYDTSINGPLANILFSAIRQLLSEIAKIKNTFNYGLYSYSGTNTAMSRVVGEYSSLENGREASEPLWAIDEQGLSILGELYIGPNTSLTNLENITSNQEGVLYVNDDTSSWNIEQLLSGISDPKVLIYIISNNFNIKVRVKGENNYRIIDLSTLNYNETVTNGLYSVLLLFNNTLNNNFIWISIKNSYSDLKILEGYLNIELNLIVDDLYTLDDCYLPSKIDFSRIRLSKCNIYSKYLDFSEEVISSTPSEEDYRYKVAHITIRSIDTYDTLDRIKNELPENELIFVEDTKKLYIKNNFELVAISASDNGGENNNHHSNNEMDKDEILQMLESIGIYANDETGNLETRFSEITFIHLETGIKFNLEIDSDGNLRTTKISDDSLTERINKAFNNGNIGTNNSYRGFIGRLLSQEYVKTLSSSDVAKDMKLYSDRLKIGAFYAPASTNKTFGCSHCFVELENTSDSDIPLEGCYLHYLKGTTDSNSIYHLALTGVIPKQSTYLIRGAKKAEYDDPNTFIKVKTFDLEWWIGSNQKTLLDFSHSGLVESTGSTYIGKEGGAFILTYGKGPNEEDPLTGEIPRFIEYNDKIWEPSNADSNAKALYPVYYIDSVVYNKDFKDGSGNSYWTIQSSNKVGEIMSYIKNGIFPDCIYRNTFELDPAKQAFLSLNAYDSSRYRHANAADYLYLYLGKEFIEFPHSDDKCPVSKFTPKASFEHKNVCTDKTQLDIEKPNMVTCSFGKNPYTTRCFNWISGGLFDEYVWIKDLSDNTIWHRFESYKEGDEFKSLEPGDLKRKEFNNADIINCVYKRMTGRFPAANTQYTAHKCIINIVLTAVLSPTKYTYIVGRADKNGNPDFEHCSEEYTFTLYPTSYIPRIYQITDQQGFHWIEYQAWAAAAKVVNKLINNETSQENIIPILVNTGDMTLSGARINEWLDYYNAGKCLFNHLELMNVVGNNDLCGNDFTIIGTGDDEGKANSYYFHLFYCYEVETESNMIPIIVINDNKKYVPSLYRVIFNTQMLLFVNSEITIKNCSGWYKAVTSSNIPVNIYTGWEVKNDKKNSSYMANDLGFTTIYTMLWNMTNNLIPFIAICHEMPFTVITKENISTTKLVLASDSRSLSRKGEDATLSFSLVGSHLNQISKDDKVGIYWFSRLLEYRGCKLCIGGHKHTYSSTYPVMENYLYNCVYYTEEEANNINNEHVGLEDWVQVKAGDIKNCNKSSVDGPMPMSNTLENDKTTTWEDIKDNVNINLSKFPLTLRKAPIEGFEEDGTPVRRNSFDFNTNNTYFYPSEFVDPETGFVGNNSGIIYFMCLATGFKLMSNKELPSLNLTFSLFLPKSNEIDGKATGTQRYPMYSVIKIGENEHDYEIQLIRLKNILSGPTKLFTLVDHGTSNIVKHYLYDNSSYIDSGDTGDADTQNWEYGGWTTNPTTLITI